MDMDNNPHFPRGLIQVAGVHDIEETRLLLELGVDLIGIPLRLTVNAEDLSEADARDISRTFPEKICLITYLDTPETILELVQFLGVSVIQLHGDVDPAIIPHVKLVLPDLQIIKSLVIGKGSMADLEADVRAFAPHVAAFITDTYNPETGAEGATGLTHDWEISRQLTLRSPRPVILAGGLSSANVGEAIRTVRPHGVDIHTGAEDVKGRKTAASAGPFIMAAKAAYGAF